MTPVEYRWDRLEASCTEPYLGPVVDKWLGLLPEGAAVLDAGCGNGATLARLAGARRFELAGLEISGSGLAIARRLNPGVEILKADLTADLNGHQWQGRFDAVVSLEVVEHVFLPRMYARNCHGFLKPGGRLIVSTPYHGWMKNVALAVTGKMDDHFTALWDFGHIKFWSRKTLGLLLEEAGFRLIGFSGAGRVPFLWKSMVLVAERVQ
jgi:2-polyprenyl-6-hydroxyphenyl methylase/3-demethylubiquinone-9 3-methyltransferase